MSLLYGCSELIPLQSVRIGLNIECITTCSPKLSKWLISNSYLSRYPDSIAHGGIFSVLLSLLCLIFTQIASIPILEQVQVVTQHGAQTPITKTATMLQDASSTHTPIGQKHLYKLGVWLQAKYTGLGVIGSYNSTSVRLESSDYDQTIVSAQMLAQGLFAGRQSNDLLPTFARNSDIPVYTNIKVNNITIWANDKCPLFWKRLINLYSSGPLLTMEHDHSPLLAFLSNVSAFQSYVVENIISLSNL